MKWKEIIVESGLIVFSILLALTINQCQNSKKEKRDKEETVKGIVSEINQNVKNLDQTIAYHQAAIKKLKNVLKNEKPELENYTTIEVVRNSLEHGLKPPNLQNTSWNSAVISNNIGLLDLDVVKMFSNLYSQQNKGVEKTWDTIADFVFSRESYDSKYTSQNIQVLIAYLEELNSQEKYLKDEAKKILAQYDNKK